MDPQSRILILGGNGLVGRAIHKKLTKEGYFNVMTPSSMDLDLTRQNHVERFFKQNQNIEYVFLAAGKVGGIRDNALFGYDYLYVNALIALNVFEAIDTFCTSFKKLVYLGSSCIYPRDAVQPIRESSLLTGPLEKTNEGYAVAKILGVKLCQLMSVMEGKVFVSVMPTNLYGPHDNFNLETSHVIPGMMRRFHEAKVKQVDLAPLWGSGTPRREFLHVDDAATGIFQVMIHYNDTNQPINLGSGLDLTIKELAHIMKDVTGYTGPFHFSETAMDGTPQKLLDNTKITALGFKPKIPLVDGLKAVYQWACVHEF